MAKNWVLSGSTLTYGEEGANADVTLTVTGITESNSETFVGTITVGTNKLTLSSATSGVSATISTEGWTFEVADAAQSKTTGTPAWSFDSDTSTATYAQPKTAGFTGTSTQTITYTAAGSTTLATVTGVVGIESLSTPGQDKVITVGLYSLGTGTVEVTGEGYTLELDDDDDVPVPITNTSPDWYVSTTDTMLYGSITTEGYTLDTAGGSKKITYKPASNPTTYNAAVIISALENSSITFSEQTKATYTAAVVVSGNEGSRTVTMTGNPVAGIQVQITAESGYSFADLNGAQKPSLGSAELNFTKGVKVEGTRSAGYTKTDDKTITYQAKEDDVVLATVTGLSSANASNVSLDGTTVKIKADALADSDVSISTVYGYTLNLDSKVIKTDDEAEATYAWVKDGDNYNYVRTNVVYYVLDGNKITYKAATGVTVATVTGLANGVSVSNGKLVNSAGTEIVTVSKITSDGTVTGYKVKLEKDALPTAAGTVTITDGTGLSNQLELGTGVTDQQTAPAAANRWVQGTDDDAYIYQSYVAGYYTLESTNKKTITYTAEDPTEICKVEGLKEGLLGKTEGVANTSATSITGLTVDTETNHTVTVANTIGDDGVLDAKTIEISYLEGKQAYTLSFTDTDSQTDYYWTQSDDDWVYNSYTPAHYALSGGKIVYTPESSPTALFTVSGSLLNVTTTPAEPEDGAKITALSGISVSGTIVTITKDAIKDASDGTGNTPTDSDTLTISSTSGTYSLSFTNGGLATSSNSTTAWTALDDNEGYAYQTTTQNYYSTTSTSITYYDATTTTHVTVSGTALKQSGIPDTNKTWDDYFDVSANRKLVNNKWTVTGYKVTVKADALKTLSGGETITVGDGITAAGVAAGLTNEIYLDSSLPTAPTVTRAWAFNNGTATYTSTTSAYYSYDNGTFTYHAEAPVTLATITGLKSDYSAGANTWTQDIVLSNGVITLSSNVLENTTDSDQAVTLTGTGGYKLALAAGIADYDDIADTPNYAWITDTNGNKIITGSLKAGYRVNDEDNTISYKAARTAQTLATVYGLKATGESNAVVADNGTITVYSGGLTNSSVQLVSDYANFKLTLDGGVTTETTKTQAWVIPTSGTAEYRNKTSAFYTIATGDSPKTITYTAAATGALLARLEGISNQAAVNDAGELCLKVTQYKEDKEDGEVVPKKAVTVDNVSNTITFNKVTYKDASNQDASAASVLGTNTVTLSNGTGQTYSLAIDNNIKRSSSSKWVQGTGTGEGNNGYAATEIKYVTTYTNHHSLSGNTVTYDNTNSEVVVHVTGLKDSISVDTDGKIAGTAVISLGGENNKTVTLKDAAYNKDEATANFTVSNGYTLALDGITNTDAQVTNSWKMTPVGSSTSVPATTKAEYIPTTAAYLENTSGTNYTYHKETDGSAIVTLEGLKTGLADGDPITGITIDTDNKIVTITSTASLTSTDVTLSGTDWKFVALDSSLAPQQKSGSTPAWSKDTDTNTTANLKVTWAEGYTKSNDTTITYTAEDPNHVLATITGLKADAGDTSTNFTMSGTTITLAAAALNEGTVTLTTGASTYALALADDVKTADNATYDSAKAAFTKSGDTYTYTMPKEAYYTLAQDSDSITYNATPTAENIVSITGLASDLVINNNDKKQIYDSTSSTALVTVNGTVITLKKDALPTTDNATVTLSNGTGYTIAFGSDVTENEKAKYQDPAWGVLAADGKSVTTPNVVGADGTVSYAKSFSAGYELSDGSRTVTYYENANAKAPEVLIKLEGLKAGASTANIVVEDYYIDSTGRMGYRVILPADVLDTTTVSVTSDYNSKVVLDLANTVTKEAQAVDGWAVESDATTQKATVYYGRVMSSYHELTDNTVVYHAETYSTANNKAQIQGLDSTLNVTKDDLGNLLVVKGDGNSSVVSVDTTTVSGKTIVTFKLADDAFATDEDGAKVHLKVDDNTANVHYTLAFANESTALDDYAEGNARFYQGTGDDEGKVFYGVNVTTAGYKKTEDTTTLAGQTLVTDLTYYTQGYEFDPTITITGLDTTKEGFTVDGIIKGTDSVDDGNGGTTTVDIVTISNTLLGTDDVTISDGYQLRLANEEDSTAVDKWFFESGTLKLVSTVPAYHSLDTTNNKIVYHEEDPAETAKLSIRGLKSDITGTVTTIACDDSNGDYKDGTTIKIGNTAVAKLSSDKAKIQILAGANANGTITLTADSTGDYKNTVLDISALPSPASTSGTSWEIDGTTAKYNGNLGAGYTLSENKKSATYAESNSTTWATITGIKSGRSVNASTGEIDGITLSGSVFKLDNRVLDTTKVTLTTADEVSYTLAIDTETESTDATADGYSGNKVNGSAVATYNEWTNNTAGSTVYYKAMKPAYYAVNTDGDEITYTALAVYSSLAQITGLNGIDANTNIKSATEYATLSNEDKANVKIIYDSTTITLKKSALTTKNVVLNSTSAYNLAVWSEAGAEKVEEPKLSGEISKTVSGSKATFTATYSAGYTLNTTTNKSLTYTAAKDTVIIATINGIATSSESLAQDDIDGDIAINDTTKKITLGSKALTTKNVTVTGSYGYTLQLDEGDSDIATSTDTFDAWTSSGTTAYFKTGNTPAYYSVSSGNIIYTAEKAGSTALTITGLKSDSLTVADKAIAGISVADTTTSTTGEDGTTTTTVTKKKVTLDRRVLNTTDGSKVTFTKASGVTYDIEIDVDTTTDEYKVTKSTDGKKEWTVSGSSSKTATLKLAKGTGYIVTNEGDTHTVTYTTGTSETLLTISGLNSSTAATTLESDANFTNEISGITVATSKDESGDNAGKYKVTLTADVLGTAKVKFTGTSDDYYLALDNEVTQEAEDSYKWYVSGTTATYRKVKSAYYTIDGNTVTYTAEKVGDVMATVKGLTSGLTVSSDGLSLMKEDAAVVTVTADAEDTGNILVKAAALASKNVTLTNSKGTYELTVPGSGAEGAITGPTTKNYWTWTKGATSASYYADVSADGYTVADDKLSIIYSAVKKSKVFEVRGLKKITDETVTAPGEGQTGQQTGPTGVTLYGTTITVANSALTSTNVTVSNSDYKLATGEGVVTDPGTAKDGWIVSGTTLTYKNSTPEYYSYNEKSNVITYNKASAGTTHLTIGGNALLSGLTVTDGLIDGISIDTTNTKIMLSGSVLKPVVTDSTAGNYSSRAVAGNKVSLSIKNSAYADYKIGLEADATASTESSEKTWAKASDATTATYSSAWNEGYKLSTDGKTVNYAAATTTLYATLSGLNKTLTAETLADNVMIEAVDTDDDGTTDTNVITLNNTVMADSTKVTVKGTGYKLAIDANTLNTDNTAADEWQTNNDKTVAYYRTVVPTYYALNAAENTITKNNEKITKTWVTVSGLKANTYTDGKITIDEDNVITLDSSLVNTTGGKKITISGNGYTFSTEGLTLASATGTTTWGTVSKGAVTLTGTTQAGVEISTDKKTLTYNDRNTSAQILKLSGLSTSITSINENILTLSGTTITLKEAALGTTNVTVNNPEYTLALDDSVQQSGDEENYWTVSGTTATFQQGNVAYYTLDESTNTVKYTKAATATPLMQISGLASGLKAFTDDEGKNVFGTIAADGTKAVLATVEESAESTDDNTIYVVTLKKDALPAAKNGAKVILTDKNTNDNISFQLAFDTSDEQGVAVAEEGDATWTINGTTATYGVPKSEGYWITTTTSTITATYGLETSTTLAQITGLNGNIAVTDDEKESVIERGLATKGTAEAVARKEKTETYLNEGTTSSEVGTNTAITVALPLDVFTNTNVAISDKNTKDAYTFKLALGDDVATETSLVEGWKVNGTTATYQSYNDAYYTIANTATNVAVTFKKATTATTWLTISGLKSGLQVLNKEGETTTTELGTIEGITIDGTDVVLSESVLPFTYTDEDDPSTRSATNNSKVTLTGKGKINSNQVTDFSKYELKLDDDTLIATNQSNENLEVSGSNVILKNDISAGYNFSTDGRTLTYATAKDDTTLVTIKGLDLSVSDRAIAEAMENDSTLSTTALAKAAILDQRISDNVSISGNEITLKEGILGTSTVSVTNATGQNYELKLNSDVATATKTNKNVWVISGTTAYYRNVDTAFYTEATNGTITYTAAKNNYTMATIGGLASGLEVTKEADGTTSIEGITLDGNTITLSNDVLGTSKVTLTQGTTAKTDGTKTTYALELDTDVNTDSDTTVTEWVVSNGTAYYRDTRPAYYTKTNDTTITRTADKVTATMVTVSGLNKSLTAEEFESAVSGNAITLTEDMLTTGNVTLKNGKDAEDTVQEYYLALSGGVNTSNSKSANKWTVSGSKATYTTYNEGYYTLASGDTPTSVTYGKEAVTGTLVVSGIKSGLTVNASDAETNPNAIDGIDLSGSTITLDNSVLNNANVTLTGTGSYASGYGLALADSGTNKVTQTAVDSEGTWSVSGTTATYKNGTYYTVPTSGTATTVTVHKANAETLFTIAGLKSGLKVNATTATTDPGKINGITLNDNESKVTLDKRVLGTTNVTFNRGTGEYKDYVLETASTGTYAVPSAAAATTEYTVSGTNVTYNKFTGGYFTADATNEKTVLKYTAAGTKTAAFVLSGLKSGLKVDTDTGLIDGITITDSVIKLDNRALGTSVVKFTTNGDSEESTKYTLAIDTTTNDYKVTALADAAPAWNTNTAKTATYRPTTVSYEVSENADSITYVATTAKTYASVSVNKENILLDDNNIKTVSGAQWVSLTAGDTGNNTTFNISGEYAFEFASDIDSATVTGGATADTIKSSGDNMTFNGGNGADSIIATGSIAVINGGNDNDVISYAPGTANTTAGKINGDAGDDTITIANTANGNLTIAGGAGVDAITVNGTGDNRITGDAGADVIVIGSTATGNNTVYGGADDDSITVTGKGTNLIYGDAGADTILINATDSSSKNSVYGGKGDDIITFGAGADTLFYANGDGNDEITSFDLDNDAIKITSGSITEAVLSGEDDAAKDLVLTIGTGSITLKEFVAADAEETPTTFTYYNNKDVATTVNITAASADLAESADLIYDDANFTTNDLSDIVNTSRDTFSVGGVNATEGLDELNDPNALLTYGKDENKNK